MKNLIFILSIIAEKEYVEFGWNTLSENWELSKE